MRTRTLFTTLPSDSPCMASSPRSRYIGVLITLEISNRGAASQLTDGQVRPIVGIDLALEDIRACEYRGTTGSLASMKVVAEASTPGAKLIPRGRRFPGPDTRTGESWPRHLNEEPRPAVWASVLF